MTSQFQGSHIYTNSQPSSVLCKLLQTLKHVFARPHGKQQLMVPWKRAMPPSQLSFDHHLCITLVHQQNWEHWNQYDTEVWCIPLGFHFDLTSKQSNSFPLDSFSTSCNRIISNKSNYKIPEIIRSNDDDTSNKNFNRIDSIRN